MTRARRTLSAVVLAIALVVSGAPAHAATAPARPLVPMAAPGAAWNMDELLFFRVSGYQTNEVTTGLRIGDRVGRGSLTSTWHQVAPIDLDGDRQDEVLLYSSSTRRYVFRDVTSSGRLGSTIRSGTMSATWTHLRAIDLDGDQHDELLLYSASTGRYQYRNMGKTGAFGSILNSGTYPTGLRELVAIDLDGDQRDELLLYRSDLSYTFFDISRSGTLGTRLRSGAFSSWTTITAVDGTSGASDEILFHSSTRRSYALYDISSSGSLGGVVSRGTLSTAWRGVAGLNVDRRPTTVHPFVSQIVDLVNAERRRAGLGALSVNTMAQTEAARWSGVQAAEQRMYHRSDLFRGLPSSTRLVGENVAVGYSSAAAVMAGWMSSSGHRRNILNPEFTEIGVGVVADRHGTLYFTQIFLDR